MSLHNAIATRERPFVFYGGGRARRKQIKISPNLNTSHTQNKRRPRHKKGKSNVGNHQEMAQSERNFHSKTGVLRLLSFLLLKRWLEISFSQIM